MVLWLSLDLASADIIERDQYYFRPIGSYFKGIFLSSRSCDLSGANHAPRAHGDVAVPLPPTRCLGSGSWAVNAYAGKCPVSMTS